MKKGPKSDTLYLNVPSIFCFEIIKRFNFDWRNFVIMFNCVFNFASANIRFLHVEGI